MSEFTFSRVYAIECEKTNCLNAIASKECGRNDVVGFYADCIRAEPTGRSWAKEVNAAILLRWKASGLNYIKKAAWKQIQQKTC